MRLIRDILVFAYPFSLSLFVVLITQLANRQVNGRDDPSWDPFSKSVSPSQQMGMALRDELNTGNQVSMDMVRYAWYKMDIRYREYFKSQVSKMKPVIQDLADESELSYKCVTALQGWLRGLGKMDLWAWSMWNAWGRLPPPGFFQAIYQDEGSIRACEKVNLTAHGQWKLGQETRFCRLRFKAILKEDAMPFSGLLVDSQMSSNPLLSRANHSSSDHLKTELFRHISHQAPLLNFQGLTIGSCWPEACSESDISALVNTASTRMIMKAENPVSCTTKKDHFKLGTVQKFGLLLLCLQIIISLLATLIDYMSTCMRTELDEIESEYNLPDQLINVFSIRRNIRWLFNVRARITRPQLDQSNSGFQSQEKIVEPLSCLDGFRLLSILWLIYAQTLVSYEPQAFMKIYQRLERLVPSFLLLPFMNADLAIDSFYLLAGLLSGYTVLSLGPFKCNRTFFILIKCLMMSPINLVVVILFGILPAYVNLPFYWTFTNVSGSASHCLELSLAEKLYLQPSVNKDFVCWQPGYWMFMELTFLLISFILVKTLYYCPRWGIVLNTLIIIGTLIANTYILFGRMLISPKLPALVQNYKLNQLIGLHHRPQIHATAYFIGILASHYLVRLLKEKKTNHHLNKILLNGAWILSVIGISMALWGYHYLNLGYLHDIPALLLYYTGIKIWFPLSLVTLVYICVLGFGGQLNYMLSHENMKYPSKLIETMFICHMLSIYTQSGTFDRDFEPYTLNLLYLCVTNSCLIFALALLIWLLFEAPVYNLQKLLLGREYERLETFESQHGIGVTIYHHPKTKTVYYKDTLFIEHSDDQ